MPSHIKASHIQNRSSSQSYARGSKMYQQGAVFDMIRRGNEITGRCEGSSPEAYYVRATLDNKGNIVQTSCDCEYSYEGDCKHIVALLLTYAQKPQTFIELPPTQDILEERSKEELITLIQQMVARHPELQSIIDRPVPSQQIPNQPIDLASFRRELQDALTSFDYWGDTGAADTVLSIADSAQAFADAGQWHNASAIYQLIFEECAKGDYPADDEGEFAGAISEVVEGALEFLGRLQIANDDIERPKLVRQLLELYLWDIRLGGIDIGEEYLPDALLAYIASQDVPPIRQRVQAIQQQQRQSTFGGWRVEILEEFLIKLDAIEGISEETILKRLRSQGMYMLLFEKLLGLKREEEAIEVAEKHLGQSPQLITVLAKLVEAGRAEDVSRLAKRALKQGFDTNIARWLAEFYYKRQDREAFFELQLQWMKAHPSPQVYSSLKTAAEKIGIWENVRGDIFQQLQKSTDKRLLIQIYLIEEAWDAAWDLLEQIPEKERGTLNWSVQPNIDLLVAELSGHAQPQKAIPIYLKYARLMVGQRTRPSYQIAAAHLGIARRFYIQLDDEEAWKQVIDGYRSEFRTLRAFQDELNKAGL